jgi:hypothetical protein
MKPDQTEPGTLSLAQLEAVHQALQSYDGNGIDAEEFPLHTETPKGRARVAALRTHAKALLQDARRREERQQERRERRISAGGEWAA